MIKIKGFLFLLIGFLVSSTAIFAEQNPMLERVRQVSVTIDHAGLEPNEPAIDWASLQAQIENKLKEGGVKITSTHNIKAADIPDLRITSKMLAVPDTEEFVFHIETSLYRFVSIPDKSNVQVSAPVWTSSTTMQSTEAEDVIDAATKATLKQADEFITAWKAANIKKSAEPNNKGKIVAAPQEGSSPTSKSAQPAGTYIASKNSKVFHLATCTTAKTISGDNMVTFALRQEAIDSGRRPCKKCNP